jgi:hypothetical protein
MRSTRGLAQGEPLAQDAGDDALACDDGPIFSTVAELVEALKRSIPEGTQNAERKKLALRLGLRTGA